MPPPRPPIRPSPRPSRTAVVTRAVVGALFTVALLVGTPWLLVRFVGNPLPTVVPSWDDVSYALSTGSIEPATWLKGLALVAWVAWVGVVTSFAVELLAVARGKATTTIRGLGAVQWLAARLVAQWTLAGSLLFGPGAGAATVSLSALPLLIGGPDEAALVVADDAPDMDRRGPDDQAPDHQAPGYLPVADIEVEPGDNLWVLSEHRLERLEPAPDAAEIATYVGEVVDENLDEIDDPDLIFPGQVFVFPPIGEPTVAEPVDELVEDETLGEEASGEELTSGPTMPPMLEPPPERQRPIDVEWDASPVHHEDAEQGRADEVSLVALGVAGGLLAAGGLGAVRRRRRYRLAHRAPGTRPGPPGADLGPVERVLHWQADPDLRDWLEAAFLSLGGRPIWEGEEAAQPVLACMRDDHLEVEYGWADPVAAPLPWSPSAGGLRWRLGRDDKPTELHGASFSLPPVPAMVTVGVGTFLNLEAVGVLAITGEGDGPMALVRSIVHELATSPAAGICDVRSTIPIPGTEAYALVQVQSAEGLTDELGTWLDDISQRMDEARSVNAYAHRLITAGDPVGPVVVVTDAAGSTALAPIWPYAVARNLPLALIVVGVTGEDAGTGFSIDIGPRKAVVQPWDLMIDAQGVSAAVARKLGGLLVDAASATTLPLTPTGLGLGLDTDADADADADVERTDGSAEPSALSFGSGSDDAGQILFRVLGEVDVGTTTLELTSQQLSLLCYLACHGPSSRASIIEALWDGQAISGSRFPNLLAETRARIGRHHLPEARDGRYEVKGVTIDLVRFERLLSDADSGSPNNAVNCLRRALGLVRGVPFTPPSSRFWTWVGDTTHHSAHVEVLVAEAAARLAGLGMESDDLGLAQWACEQGLLASPGDEALVTLLAEVYVKLGKLAAAHRLVGDWEETISRLDCGEPSDGPRQRLRHLLTPRLVGR